MISILADASSQTRRAVEQPLKSLRYGAVVDAER